MSFKESSPRSLKIIVVALLHLRSSKTRLKRTLLNLLFLYTKLWGAIFSCFNYYLIFIINNICHR